MDGNMRLLTLEESEGLFDFNEEEPTEETDDKGVKEEKEEEEGNEKEEDPQLEETKGLEDAVDTGDSSSPNFYSSIANALVEDGITPDLNIKDVRDAESFADAIKEYIDSQLDETQKRINDALNYGMEASEIKFYENTIANLGKITDEFLENEDNEDFRRRLIMQDLINKDYSEEEAKEEVNDIFDSGNDIKKAKRALVSLKSFYDKQYKGAVKEAKEEADKASERQQQELKQLKESIMQTEKVFGDMEFSKADRQKAYDVISKPVYKDPKTGAYQTALQKYQSEHGSEFLKNVGMLFVLTDGFKKMGSLIEGKVNKESKKALRDLENKLVNTTSRNSEGNLRFSGGFEDTESAFKSYRLDI